MKSVFLFSTKMRFFISEIPLIALYVIAVMRNSASTAALKLYPLQIGSLILIAFIALYFYRGIRITNAEIAHVGRFSPRYKAIINKDKTLILTLKSRGKMKVVLFGNNGLPPIYSGEGEDADKPVDIELFTGYTLGREKTAVKILKYFGVSEELAKELTTSDKAASVGYTELSSSVVGGEREIRILFTKTV